MNSTENLLRIRISLSAAPLFCEWVLISANGESLSGKGTLSALPKQCKHVEVVLPAADVLLARASLPHAARRQSAALLAYAVEDSTAREPENNEVSWLGLDARGTDVLAVVDKPALMSWRAALTAAGISDFQLCCETLLLPWTAGTWSLAWDGAEGFVRTGKSEGCATDYGDSDSPPLSLHLLLDMARKTNASPSSLQIHLIDAAAAPNWNAWSLALGVNVEQALSWHWGMVSEDAGPVLAPQHKRWQLFDGLALRLRPALWMLGVALVVQALVTLVFWSSLAKEQHGLRVQMDKRFRVVFPEAVTVVDPVLQMRRQLSAARQSAGTVDNSDFLPLLALVARVTSEFPSGTLRTLSYERGRFTLELSDTTAIDITRLLEQLRQSGLGADMVPSISGNGSIILTVRST